MLILSSFIYTVQQCQIVTISTYGLIFKILSPFNRLTNEILGRGTFKPENDHRYPVFVEGTFNTLDYIKISILLNYSIFDLKIRILISVVLQQINMIIICIGVLSGIRRFKISLLRYLTNFAVFKLMFRFYSLDVRVLLCCFCF